MTRTTSAPPIRAELLPATRAGRLWSAGLTDPLTFEAAMHRRASPIEAEPRSADVFRVR